MPERARVPAATRWMVEKKCSRSFWGFSRLPRRAVGGSMTWLKRVRA